MAPLRHVITEASGEGLAGDTGTLAALEWR